MTQRQGCYCCFQTLDPDRVQAATPGFLRCQKCQAVYHSACWHNPGTCLRCGNSQTVPIQVARPPALRPSTLKRAVPVQPSVIVEVQDGAAKNAHPRISWQQAVAHVAQVVVALVVAMLLVSWATVLAVHIPRLFGQNSYTFQSIMDLLVRGSMPAVPLWSGALVAGLASALAIYVHTTPVQGDGHPSVVTRFVAGVLIVAWFDLVFYDILTLDVINWSAEIRPTPDLWIVQGIAAVIVLLFTPIYRRLSRIKPLPAKLIHSSLAANLYGWVRLILMTALLVVAVAYASARMLPQVQNRPEVMTAGMISVDVPITLPFVGAALAALAVAAFVFRSPPFRGVTRQLMLVRLLLFVLAGVALGLLYRDAENPTGYLNAVIFGLALVVISVPVQRTLS